MDTGIASVFIVTHRQIKPQSPSDTEVTQTDGSDQLPLHQLFTIALSFSLLFFLLTLYLFGIPKPISSHFKPRSLTRRLSTRRAVTRKKPGWNSNQNGAWTQGWKVSYKGDEWDSEKLKVFVVPHSHNDPGWKFTVEEYYERQSRHILDTIVETLSKDTRRKFIWEEISYLQRWWRDASEDKRESFTNLLKNGQLEIVGGGWVMNDEANSHYFAIIEQVTEGNMWLNDTIGFIPKNSWAIDPFGYSPTMAYLLRRMGFENMLIQRTHYELKKELAWNKNLEYIWRQSWDADETTDIFVHMMPFYSYDVPHTCGPEPAVCCQFDFARINGFFYERCPWGHPPIETDQENVQERALKLLDQYRKKSTLYRRIHFLYLLEMISVILNAEARFGTLDDYFQTLRDEADRINYSLPSEIGSSEVVGFPSLSGDFFTYADRQQDYWSGYYVSRPFFKAVDRVLEQTLRASEILMAFLFGYCQRIQCEKLPMGYAYKLIAARRNLALFQHHDGVTGTAKNHVVLDYGIRMHTSLQDLQIFMSKAIEVLLGIRQEKAVSAREGTIQSVVLFNPLEQTREEVVMLVVNRPEVTVLDSNWTCVQSQVSPELQHDKSKIFTGRHRVHWKASVPAMGLQTYYIANGFVGCEKAKPAKLKLFSNSSSIQCPTPYTCSEVEGDVVEIENPHQTLTFEVNRGLLQKVIQNSGPQNAVAEEISVYSSTGGAYLFLPEGEAVPIIRSGGHMVISEGPLMQEVYSYPMTEREKTPISHSTRIYNGGNTIQEFLVEKEYHVELLGKDFTDKELIVRYKTDINNKRIFYSDLNGFQMSRRETYDKIPLQGNYYPMPSLAFMQGSNGRRFSVHSRQSLGAASLKQGWLEIMLDRRLAKDDGRGLGQGVMDNRVMNVVFHILLESNISSTSNPVSNPQPLSPSLLSHCVSAQLNHPLQAFIAKKPQDISVQTHWSPFSPLTTSLPCDLHIVSLKVPRPAKYSQQQLGDPRFVLMLHRRNWDPSYCPKARSQCTSMADAPVNLFNLFKDLEVLKAKPTSLNLLHDDTEMLGYAEQFSDVAHKGHVIIPPMEIQTYKLELRPLQQTPMAGLNRMLLSHVISDEVKNIKDAA
ncbi:Alpha-mannosidase 2 [Hibiscus syriacus]|uniref:Alpha-mannosidase n=1 Tax=Hibiscus syriacus TaxID=106335 RepID=A0A6A2X256_HIBSY|nr:Alpha-mannosidase 2 [Hibiscus syriacus]